MQGKRLYDYSNIQPGDFFLHDCGSWYGMTPNGHMCNLANHKVVEHDGVITVSPSIKVSTSEVVWHGYLENGIWREC